VASTTGLVQRLSIFGSTAACAWIGPRPNNSEVLVVTNDASTADLAFASTLIQALTAASTNFRAVTAIHEDSSARIILLRIDPV
jgi:hypothetical protein